MTERLDLDGLERRIKAFSTRFGELRGGAAGGVDPRAGVDPRVAAALESALLELEVAEEELQAAQDELIAQRGRLDPAADRERRLLRALVGELPVPVFLLERDGIVRRANRAACELVDTPAAYPVGKPFTTFVSQRDRGALRYAVSAAAAGAAGTPVRGSVLAQGRPREVVLRLAPLRLPGEAEQLVAVVAIAVGPGSPLGTGRAAAAPAGPDGNPPAVPGEPVPPVPAGARRLDTMAAMTRLLLEPPAAEDDLLARAADLLLVNLADAVLVDLPDPEHATLTRRVAAGAGPGTRLTGMPVGRRTLPGRTAATRRPQLVSRLESPADLGALPDGGAAGTALGGTTAAAAPLLPPGSDGPVLGVVTLVRREGGAYDLAELGLLQQLCEHLALALRARRAARPPQPPAVPPAR